MLVPVRLLRISSWLHTANLFPAEGWRALSLEVVSLLRREQLMHTRSLCGILDVLVKNSRARVPIGPYRVLRPLVLRHLLGPDTNEGEVLEIARHFLVKLADTVQGQCAHPGYASVPC